jgi:hypothetical protein
MQTEEHNNGQRSPPIEPRTGPHLQRIIKVVLGCQTINGINPRSGIRQQQHISLFNPACEMSENYFKLGHALFHPYLFQYCFYQLSFYLRPRHATPRGFSRCHYCCRSLVI